ncbi:MAG: PaaI family thioesterase [Thermoplasmataceae archaeon]
MDNEEFFQKILQLDGFLAHLDLSLKNAENGKAVIQVEFNDKIMRPGGIMHGGAISSLFDLCGGIAIFTSADIINSVTIELNIVFMRQVNNGPVEIRGNIERIGRRTAFASMELYDGKGELCSRGSGIWSIFRE